MVRVPCSVLKFNSHRGVLRGQKFNLTMVFRQGAQSGLSKVIRMEPLD